MRRSTRRTERCARKKWSLTVPGLTPSRTANLWLVLLAIFVTTNLISLRAFGETEFWLASIKVVAIVAFILTVLAMGTLTYKGATAKEALASETIVLVPEWAEKEGIAKDSEAYEGANLFAVSGCLQCHTYLGTGGGDGPIRGYISAFNAKTGEEVWRFYTIPGPGEPVEITFVSAVTR